MPEPKCIAKAVGILLLGICVGFIINGGIPEQIHLEGWEREALIAEQDKLCDEKKADTECRRELRASKDTIKGLEKANEGLVESNTKLSGAFRELRYQLQGSISDLNEHLSNELSSLFSKLEDTNQGLLDQLATGWDCNCFKKSSIRYACKCT